MCLYEISPQIVIKMPLDKILYIRASYKKHSEFTLSESSVWRNLLF